MMIIALSFLAIGWYERRYMKKYNRSSRARRLMWTITVLLLIMVEAIYLTREQMSVAIMVKHVFYGLQKLLFLET
ncbi:MULTISPECIES: hypothetical protein [unclassified Paenibacillus]|uniref:hypothetical protein n=1 Tax=unclassified Paenibacillus TaxID=185978 RepID=UPI0024061453|nr:MULTISPECIES: hypothetical protein [unclassified Paenibacillus]MDF9839049.1 hypothetical protein [Paenibacillus sp. PastF-2]MDF9845631.1 hypothetical protein [Paenibacillus sp. PastM-2]MDF9852203.1 hypothetical protein [Paenibacillus sp. PastF-1]MDH6478068.1 hypothetical protein [Paenibacillus sp. PastH-2]MDH6505802.1 hypothetical protein [Paenibacillus sp. PastM-3]